MKKTIISLLTLTGVATAELGSETYTWVTAGDGTPSSPSIGSTTAVTGGVVPTFTGYDGVTQATDDNYGYLSQYAYCETGSNVLYDAITQSLSSTEGKTEAVSLTLNFSFAFGTTGAGTTTLLQVGANGSGVGINLKGGHVYLTLSGSNTYDLGAVTVSSGTNGNRMNDVSITLSSGGYSATIIRQTDGNGTTATSSVTGDLSNSDITWTDETARVSVGMQASGWTGQQLSAQAVLLKSASAVVTTYAIPEPTTATLSLLALAGLAARRRRK